MERNSPSASSLPSRVSLAAATKAETLPKISAAATTDSSSALLEASVRVAIQPLTASDIPSEASVGPVIITGINFHDDNLNVVARSQLAQPIVKRSEDRFLFRTKIDW